MAIDRQLGTENNPDVIDQSKSVDVGLETFNVDTPEPTFDESLLDSMEINILTKKYLLMSLWKKKKNRYHLTLIW